MNIHIQDINVQHLGPVADFQMCLGPFNLIYGANEQGKTYLVEFLLKSLFRSASGSEWHLRSASPSGKVTITGLEDEPISFTPDKDRKLEEYWEEWKQGLPTNMARLLVVKGAELEMSSDTQDGISKKVLKEYLSGEKVLDKIQDQISKTVQSASILDGEIEGHNMGEIKTRSMVRDQLRKVDGLFEKIQDLYSGGERAELDLMMKELDRDIHLLQQARCYKAYQISNQINELKRDLEKLPKDKLDDLKQTHTQFLTQTHRLEDLEADAEKLDKSREDYQWLKNAISIYSERELGSKPKANTIFLILASLALAGSVLLVFLNSPFIAMFLILLGAGSGGIYVQQLRKQNRVGVDTEELQRMEKEFTSRFDKRLINLAAMRSLRDQLEEPFQQSEIRLGEIKREREDLEEVREKILAYFREISGKIYDEEVWSDRIQELREQRDELEQEIKEQELALHRLDIDPEDYLSDDPGETYDKSRLEDLRNDHEQLKNQLEKQRDELDGLKHQICTETGDDITREWEDIIQSLKEKRIQLSGDYKEITAEILAKILVTRVLGEIREQEDEKIRGRLQTSLVSEVLFDITKRYKSIDFVDERLIVNDPYNEFYLSDLSTGAQEQVLLALRIGFATQIMQENQAFLILDDAFQYADWKRRERLVEQVVQLSKKGWQILYLTMDDHIKELFDQAGRYVFKDGYKVQMLGT